MSGSLSISATEDTVESVLARNYRFQVPDYQRRYSWKEDQLREFWSDLTALDDGETHFLGSIVVIQRTGKLDELSTLELVDGQQRLATVTILLSVMRDQYRESDNEHAGVINNDYLWVHDLDRNEFQNLTLSKFDNGEYHSVLRGRWSEVDGGPLLEASKFFANRVRDLSIEEIDQLRKRLLNSMTIVTIECDDEISAFRLFETLNDRGLELSAVDLMKNYLLRVSAQSDTVNYDHVMDRWEAILENVVRDLSKPGRFFRHYIMSAKSPDVNQDVSSYRLYNVFRELIETELPANSITIEEYVEDMATQSKLYVEIVQASVDRFEDEQAQQRINTKLRNLNAIKSVQARTAMLRIFNEFENVNEVLRSLEILEIFMLRWKVANYPTGGELDRVYADLCSTAFQQSDPISAMKRYLSERSPSDDQFRTGITDKNVRINDRTKYILDTIEREHYMHSGEGIEVADRSVVDIEHIAPRNVFSAKKYSTWRSYLGVGEDVFNEHCNRLGNLTLLENRKNRGAGDDPFQGKKKRYSSSDFGMTRAICDYDSWSIENVRTRTADLANIATHIWSFDRV